MLVLMPQAPGMPRTEAWLQAAAMLLLCIAAAIPVLGIIGLNTGLPLGGCCNSVSRGLIVSRHVRCGGLVKELVAHNHAL